MKAQDQPMRVCFVVNGEAVWGDGVAHSSRDVGTSFVTPELDLDSLVRPRTEPPPALRTSVAEVIDLLVATGEKLDLATNEHLQEAFEQTMQVGTLPGYIVENMFNQAFSFLKPENLLHMVESTFGSAEVLDEWRLRSEPDGRQIRIRAFPPRLVHILAGNGPGTSAYSIAWGALVKGINLFKMPSNDLSSATAILRTMAEVSPDHPIVRSMSAVYWRGGDASIESNLFRSQYFDKLVAWGGESAISSAARYVGPGFQLVSFDPKVSISLVGHEAFESDSSVAEAAELVATDAMLLNQDACAASRFVFIEGSNDEADRFCDVLIDRLGVDRPFGSAVVPEPPTGVRDEVNALRLFDDEYRVLGACDGRGLVVRSEDPVAFPLVSKTVNVVPVTSLSDAARFASAATQTVGVYPFFRKDGVRDGLAAAGVQRVVRLGSAAAVALGSPHDGSYPMHRFINWVVDEDAS